MSHHCQDESCCHKGHGGMGMQKEGSCSCCQSSSCSCPCSCCQKSGCHGHGDHAQRLLAIADMAWMEVLKEEMKEHIRANDHKIKEMAHIVCEINKERWHNKMSQQKCNMEYEEKLKGLICGGHCSSHQPQGNEKNKGNGKNSGNKHT